MINAPPGGLSIKQAALCERPEFDDPFQSKIYRI